MSQLDPAVFREVLAQWPSGVTVVTTVAADGTRHGMTASSFSSVSLNPPLVSVCLDRRLRTHELISSSGVFGVNIMAKDQAEVARRFAGMVKDCADRFAGESWTTAETGAPLLDSALGWLDCRVVHAHPGGDHTIFVGEVVAGHAARRSAPLLFHSRQWGQFADALPEVAALADCTALESTRSDRRTAIAERLVGAGLRVRLDADTPVPVGPGSTSRLVEGSAQAHQALAAGIDVLEVELDPTDPVDVVRVCALVEGLADRCSVRLDRGFEPAALDAVLTTIAALSELGVLEVQLTDTEGAATPLQVRALLQEAVALARPTVVRVGLHDRDRLGLVKALTALKSGVSHFDTSLTGHAGVVATEHLVRLLDEVEVATAVDFAALGIPLTAHLSTVPESTPVGAFR